MTIREQLSEGLQRFYGFKVATEFVDLVVFAFEQSIREGFYDETTFLCCYGFMFDFHLPFRLEYNCDDACLTFIKNEEYEAVYEYGVPPEVFVFGDRDGIRFGFLVHDTGLQGHSDTPVVKVAEAEDGAVAWGRTVGEGIEAMMSFGLHRHRALHQEDEDNAVKDRKIIETMSNRLGIHPEVKKFKAIKVSARLTPPVPEGWRFEPGIDKVGVLAPAELFAPKKLLRVKQLEQVERLIADGFHATAMLAIRNTLHDSWHDADALHERCALLWKEIYLQLGRHLFAERVQRQIEYRRRLHAS